LSSPARNASRTSGVRCIQMQGRGSPSPSTHDQPRSCAAILTSRIPIDAVHCAHDTRARGPRGGPLGALAGYPSRRVVPCRCSATARDGLACRARALNLTQRLQTWIATVRAPVCAQAAPGQEQEALRRRVQPEQQGVRESARAGGVADAAPDPRDLSRGACPRPLVACAPAMSMRHRARSRFSMWIERRSSRAVAWSPGFIGWVTSSARTHVG
jgi:hypothetical protein